MSSSARGASARWRASMRRKARSSASSPRPSPRLCIAKGCSACGCRARVRGGLELDPVSSLEVIESVSYGDPSAGWVLMAASLAIGTGAAYLKDEAVKELFSGPRLPVIAGQGTRPGDGEADEGRLQPHGLVELCVGHQARHAHPYAGPHRGHARGAHLRAARRQGEAHRQLGRARDCARRAVSTTRRTTCSCPKPTRTWPPPRSRCAAATSIASASSASRGSAIRAGRAASAGACSTSCSPSSPRKRAAPARSPTARAFRKGWRTSRPSCARRARSSTRPGTTRARRSCAATSSRCASTR